ncbi:L,D-transpeptidase family protein [Pseudomaricurvus sp.]|uniref:L,D-transpeptidase family protein n=1 Tax=Pseudomaricurvus sp. TaxID=2004510 RepID=UPI003F6C5A82
MHNWGRVVCFALMTLLLTLQLSGCASSDSPDQAQSEAMPDSAPSDTAKDLRHWFFEDSDRLLSEFPLNHTPTLARIYANTNYQPLWLDQQKLSSAGKLLLQSLTETSADEIYDYPYHLQLIQEHIEAAETEPEALSTLDMLMSDAFVSYADDVFSDRLYPSTMQYHLKNLHTAGYTKSSSSGSNDSFTSGSGSTRHNDIVAILSRTQTPQALTDLLQQMLPDHPDYARLREALSHYQTLVNNDQWQPIYPGPTLELGMQDPQVGQLRDLLTLYGDYLPDEPGLFSRWMKETPEQQQEIIYNTFDKRLEQGLRHFQRRHGQTVDGRAGPVTRRLLNVPPEYRVRQIAFNMKRWRELPRDLGERYLWVNMTDYKLQLITHQQVELDMRIIIGKSYRPTPVMQKHVSTLVFNPYWNVPRRLVVNDILPEARKDPEYLTKKHIRIFENWESTTPIPASSIDWEHANRRNFHYRLRQEPGSYNSLGRIKFTIPDSDSIYLHDTNSPELFNKDKRTISSGCIRIEQPLALAQALLSGTRWNPGKIQHTLNSGKTRHVRLMEDIPIYLFYATAWVDGDQQIQFRDDIYKLDRLVNFSGSPVSL